MDRSDAIATLGSPLMIPVEMIHHGIGEDRAARGGAGPGRAHQGHGRHREQRAAALAARRPSSLVGRFASPEETVNLIVYV